MVCFNFLFLSLQTYHFSDHIRKIRPAQSSSAPSLGQQFPAKHHISPARTGLPSAPSPIQSVSLTWQDVPSPFLCNSRHSCARKIQFLIVATSVKWSRLALSDATSPRVALCSAKAAGSWGIEKGKKSLGLLSIWSSWDCAFAESSGAWEGWLKTGPAHTACPMGTQKHRIFHKNHWVQHSHECSCEETEVWVGQKVKSQHFNCTEHPRQWCLEMLLYKGKMSSLKEKKKNIYMPTGFFMMAGKCSFRVRWKGWRKTLNLAKARCGK